MPIPSIRPYPLPSHGELPESKVRWTPSSDRAVLLIHDMQSYFVTTFAVDQSPVPELVDNVATLKRTCADRGVPVVYTAQPGSMSKEDRGLLLDMWGPGMERTEGNTSVIPELAPSDEDTVLTKWRYSAFFRSGLEDLLRDQGRDQLIVSGVYAHIGCLMTALDAFSRDIEVFFVADAVAAFSRPDHDQALSYVARNCGVVLTTEALRDVLSPMRVGAN
ncbi:hypothetical protein GCM10012275_19890 [Longimycelium tulufanense]|uniref:Isochorismatase-like domain-containing protein n=1 Tax=Longimycelium tulufanense TaxID=907463 RepID=A0A8J3CEK6_9PSEU|nr:isochorismatase family protein [Longimycelium tulufanense]GGM49014.1 hypothetical protein GCM10012275_19890 [Longimycelium tulufanense]